MARVPKSIQDAGLLAAALEGLEIQKRRIEEQIAHVRSLLGGHKPKLVIAEIGASNVPKKHQLSEAARKRIAAAQKKRWAAYRKKAAGNKPQ